jgi:hypothetical protein
VIRAELVACGKVRGLDHHVELGVRRHRGAEPRDVPDPVDGALRRLHDERLVLRDLLGELIVASSSRSRGTTRLTSPIRCASWALMRSSPVNRSSFAARTPTIHGRNIDTTPEPNADVDVPEVRVVGRDREVAGEHQIRPAREAVGLHRGDHRLGQSTISSIRSVACARSACQ